MSNEQFKMKFKNGILTLIKFRRSVRRFKKQKIPAAAIKKILNTGRFAPSGLNNQPWRFLVLAAGSKNDLARFTKYGHIIKSADKVILVFLDRASSYHYEKDLLAVGACIQNMLLAAFSLGIGSCWLGEILNQRQVVNDFLKIHRRIQLEAVIALGYPVVKSLKGTRKPLRTLLLKTETNKTK
jgi:nitroreductase